MYLADVFLESPIRWLIHQDDPETLPSITLPHLAIVNPLLYRALPIRVRMGDHPIEMVRAPHEVDSIYVVTRRLMFTTADSAAMNVLAERELLYLSKLLRRIRFLTKQVAIPLRGWGGSVFWHSPPLKHNDIFQTDSHISAKDAFGLATALTFDILRIADTDLDDYSEAPYDGIFLDAIGGFRNRDYRTALLYSAISMEVAANTILDQRFDEIISHQPSDPRWRVNEVIVDRNHRNRIDPVYNYLRKNAKIRELLHEIPLYVSRRSLQYENPEIYKNALKLYSTRNKITHNGNPLSGEDVLQVNIKDALKGIQYSNEVQQWFGLPGLSDEVIQTIMC